MSYDAFATTFSHSRKDLYWPEIEHIIADMRARDFCSILDIGCGNGRFLEQAKHMDLKIHSYHGIDSSWEMIKEAERLHNTHDFTVFPMEMIGNCGPIQGRLFESIIFLASFHHLESRTQRIKVLEDMKKLVTPNGRIYMTNWNLRDQVKYENSHRWDGDYDIKIGAHSRYYHGFTVDELDELFTETEYPIVENRIFDGGRNIVSILSI